MPDTLLPMFPTLDTTPAAQTIAAAQPRRCKSTPSSHAVMAQRVEPLDSLDDFPTPPWGTRAGIIHALYRDDVPFRLPPPDTLTVLEPAANRGHMLHPLRDAFGTVHAFDLHDYGVGLPTHDYLGPAALPPLDTPPDLTITNPPFKHAANFVRRAMSTSRLGCAVLVRGTWLESKERYDLCRRHPPALVAQFAERLPMIEGYIAERASTATSYAWILFLHDAATHDTRWRHIPPCRRQLERPDDYPTWTAQARLMTTQHLLDLLTRHQDAATAPATPTGKKQKKATPPMPEPVIRAELTTRGHAPASLLWPIL